MDISQILKLSWNDVVEAELPADLQAIAFREAVRMRHQPAVPAFPATSGVQSPQLNAMQNNTASTNGGGVADVPASLLKLSDETGVDAIDLQDVFLLSEDGTIEILPPGRKLGSSVADKARNVTILLAGARHVLDRSRISIDDVRKACIDRGCYDSKNFKTKHLGHFDPINVRNDEVLVNPSKWLPAFVNAVKTARGESTE